MTRAELNRLSNRIIGVGIRVHKKLGPGFAEKIYEKALAQEFRQESINFDEQKVIRVKYGDRELGNQRVDFFVENEIIVETKAVSRVIDIHRNQIISYLKTIDKRLGLILNFGRKRLEIKRVVHKF